MGGKRHKNVFFCMDFLIQNPMFKNKVSVQLTGVQGFFNI